MINSPSLSIRISVVVLAYVKHQQTTAFTRFNLFLQIGSPANTVGMRVTFDHVLPVPEGRPLGKMLWRHVLLKKRS